MQVITFKGKEMSKACDKLGVLQRKGGREAVWHVVLASINEMIKMDLGWLDPKTKVKRAQLKFRHKVLMGNVNELDRYVYRVAGAMRTPYMKQVSKYLREMDLTDFVDRRMNVI